MKNPNIRNFWIGFIVSTLAVVWLYWLWQRFKETVPEPIIIKKIRPEETGLMSEESRSYKSDRLEVIRGIGPVFAKRLNEAGIYSFRQLAQTDPELLREIAGTTPWDPADWIVEARRRMA